MYIYIFICVQFVYVYILSYVHYELIYHYYLIDAL